MGTNAHRTIVVGAGAIGTAAAFTEQGQTDVLSIEQFELGHVDGASDDNSRIIRHTHHNDTSSWPRRFPDRPGGSPRPHFSPPSILNEGQGDRR